MYWRCVGDDSALVGGDMKNGKREINNPQAAFYIMLIARAQSRLDIEIGAFSSNSAMAATNRRVTYKMAVKRRASV